MTARARKTAKRTRIQEVNELKILDAALEAFGSYGFRGATVEQIAKTADMSKPNLLYYFSTKEALYAAVLERTLDRWLYPLANMDADGTPIDEIWSYVREKLNMSRNMPHESRLFAMEILQGAPVIRDILETSLKELFDERVALIQSWIDEGKLAQMDAEHMLFLIWSMTQTYADFWTQIEVLTDDGREAVFDKAEKNLKALLLKGLAA